MDRIKELYDAIDYLEDSVIRNSEVVAVREIRSGVDCLLADCAALERAADVGRQIVREER